MKEFLIIGNGIAGITAARHIRKQSNANITVISAETDYFFSRTALMYIYMGHLKYEHTKPYEDGFWVKNRIGLVRAWVESVDTATKQLTLSDDRVLPYDALILALGSSPNKFDWPGQDLAGAQGLYSYPDLELMEENTKDVKHAAIVGGGLIGIEMAEMLRSRNIGVTFLIREKNYWDNVLPEGEARMINRHIREHGVDLRTSTELKEILPDANGRVRAIVTSGGEELPCGFVGLTAGVHGNKGLAEAAGIETDRGILVDEYMTTSTPAVYAIGDCAQYRTPPPGRRPIEQVWYTGRMHGEAVAQTICGTPTKYAPGPWFNSAKFFDIEYQTYGNVFPKLPEDEATFYWEHPGGKLAFRANYKINSRQLVGVNTFGIRMRHEVFDQWLRSGASVDKVMDDLGSANFDPEFYSRHEKAIQMAFADQAIPA